MKLKPFIERWIKDRLVFGDIRMSTADWYGRCLRPLLDLIGHMPVSEISRQTVDDTYRTLVEKIGLNRTASIAIHFRNAMQEAVKQGLIATDPTADARKLRAKTKVKETTLTPAQMSALAEQSAEWGEYGAIIRFALGTGLRRAEICGLQWQDVDLENGLIRIRRAVVLVGDAAQVSIPKSAKSRRTVKLPEPLRLSLVDRKGSAEQTDWVFPDRDGKFRHPKVLTRVVGTYLAKAGLKDFTLHDLRHAHATFLLQQKMPLKAVSERLGHSDVRITLGVYAHVMPGDDDKLASAFDAML